MIMNGPGAPDPQPQPLQRGVTWQRTWRMARVPLQVLAAQMIAWALRRYLG